MSLVMAVNFGGAVYAWRSGQTIALFTVSIILLIAFALQQAFCLFTNESKRMFPVHFLGNMEADLLFVAAACGNAAMFIPLFISLFTFNSREEILPSRPPCVCYPS